MEGWQHLRCAGLSLNSQCTQAAKDALEAESSTAEEEESIVIQKSRLERMPDGIVKQHALRSLAVHEQLLVKKRALAASKRADSDALMDAHELVLHEQASTRRMPRSMGLATSTPARLSQADALLQEAAAQEAHAAQAP